MPYDFITVWSKGFFGIFSDYKFGFVMLIGILICAVLSYLLGSFNFAIILSKKKYHADIRDYGSNNAGATNVLRTYGKKAALVTFLGDGVKALIAVLLIGRLTFGLFGAYIAELFCVIGHAYPLYFKFKGGKGVTVTAFSILATNPLVFGILLIVFVICLLTTKYVSLSSITAVLLYPVVLSAVYGKDLCLLIAILLSLFVIYLHRENIIRLSKGTENKISLGKKKK